MRWTTTLILAVLALGAWFWARSMKDSEPAPPGPPAPLVDDRILNDFQEVELTLFSKEILKIVRQPGGKFVMEFGRDRLGNRWIYSDEIDSDLALQFLAAVDDGRRVPLEGEPDADDLLRANLAPPKYTMLIRGGGLEQEIHFGAADESTAGSVFALDVAEGEVFTVGRQVVNMLDLNLHDFRERRAFQFDKLAIDQVEIYYSGSLEGDPEATANYLSARRGPRDTWTVLDDQGQEYKADPNKVRGLIQRLTTLRIRSFVGEVIDPLISEQTGFPLGSTGSIVVSSGAASEVLETGLALSTDQLSARLMVRDEDATLCLDLAELRKVLETTVEDLRDKRLAPAFGSSLVALEARVGEQTRYRVERGQRNPRAPWKMVSVEGEPGVHTGTGDHSWPQLVVDLDRLEIEEFLGPLPDFQGEATLRIEWFARPVVRDLEFSMQERDGRIVATASDREGEFFVVPRLLWDTAFLELARYRDREVLPGFSEFAHTVRGIEIQGAGGLEVSLHKDSAQAEFQPRIDQVAKVTEAVWLLCGLQARSVWSADSAPDDLGLDSPRLSLVLRTEDGTAHTLELGAEDADGTGCYARLSPRFDGLILSLPLLRVRDLLALDSQLP